MGFDTVKKRKLSPSSESTTESKRWVKKKYINVRLAR